MGMLLSWRCETTLGGNIWIDLFCATIPLNANQYVKFNREPKMMFNVDTPNQQEDDMVCLEGNIGNYTVLTEEEIAVSSVTLPDSSPWDLWTMHFDRA